MANEFNDKSSTPPEHLISAYERMLDRTKHALQNAGEKAGPLVEKALDIAKQKAYELGELTREEAETVSDYVVRDIHDAANYIVEQERELGDWARLDLLLVETKLLDLFSTVVDQTKLELDQWAKNAQLFGEWNTGEITGIGTLECIQCGQTINFHKISHVPPCPKCHGTVFRRIAD